MANMVQAAGVNALNVRMVEAPGVTPFAYAHSGVRRGSAAMPGLGLMGLPSPLV